MRTRPTQIPTRGVGVYGLVGRGISYSLSPLIFQRVFEELGWPAAYGTFDLTPVRLSRFVAAAADAGIAGFNVTQPYKTMIMRYLDKIDPVAGAVGAVNTVVRQRHRWIGYNTDVDGVQQALSSYRRDLAGASAVIIGAGGAARAVAYALAAGFGASDITFAARSAAHGGAIVRELSGHCHHNCRWSTCPITRRALNASLSGATILVNATPVGGFGAARKSPLPPGVKIPRSLIVFDLVYRPRRTRLLRDAESVGCKQLVGGWEMLMAQAEESFRFWTGVGFPARVRNEMLKSEILS